MKKSLSFCSCLGLSAARAVRIKIVQIGVHITIAACTVAIAHPGLAEVRASPPGQSSLKVGDSGLQDGKLAYQLVPECCALPPGEGGVKVIERLKNDCAELSRSGSVRAVTLNGECAQDSNERNDDIEVPGHELLLILLPFWILWMSGAFTVQPTALVKLNRPD